ncbi:MAG: hypothetical protein APU95_04635 [Hadesarchaea archaeon YNP_N21]|nr:MAG: hypothetical protein APU95_04635 [Hadesarchaea archaeon YNP_N21]
MPKELKIPEIEIVETKKAVLKKPLLIMGFIGAGLVGNIAVSQIIEKLNMREIAHVRSRYLPPATVFIDGKLRHPFRIYSNKDGTICAAICEIPVSLDGLYPIAVGILDWAERKKAREVVILEGIPVTELPTERTPLCVAEENRCKEFELKGIGIPSKGAITGIAGSILNECLTRKILGISFLTPALAFMPDPEGAAKLIEAVNKVYNLNVDTSELLERGKEIEQKLMEIADRYKMMKKVEEERGRPEAMYG